MNQRAAITTLLAGILLAFTITPAFAADESTLEACLNHKDDDEDGTIDCEDSDCTMDACKVVASKIAEAKHAGAKDIPFATLSRFYREAVEKEIRDDQALVDEAKNDHRDAADDAARDAATAKLGGAQLELENAQTVLKSLGGKVSGGGQRSGKKGGGYWKTLEDMAAKVNKVPLGSAYVGKDQGRLLATLGAGQLPPAGLTCGAGELPAVMGTTHDLDPAAQAVLDQARAGSASNGVDKRWYRLAVTPTGIGSIRCVPAPAEADDGVDEARAVPAAPAATATSNGGNSATGTSRKALTADTTFLALGLGIGGTPKASDLGLTGHLEISHFDAFGMVGSGLDFEDLHTAFSLGAGGDLGPVRLGGGVLGMFHHSEGLRKLDDMFVGLGPQVFWNVTKGLEVGGVLGVGRIVDPHGPMPWGIGGLVGAGYRL